MRFLCRCGIHLWAVDSCLCPHCGRARKRLSDKSHKWAPYCVDRGELDQLLDAFDVDENKREILVEGLCEQWEVDDSFLMSRRSLTGVNLHRLVASLLSARDSLGAMLAGRLCNRCLTCGAWTTHDFYQDPTRPRCYKCGKANPVYRTPGCRF